MSCCSSQRGWSGHVAMCSCTVQSCSIPMMQVPSSSSGLAAWPTLSGRPDFAVSLTLLEDLPLCSCQNHALLSAVHQVCAGRLGVGVPRSSVIPHVEERLICLPLLTVSWVPPRPSALHAVWCRLYGVSWVHASLASALHAARCMVPTVWCIHVQHVQHGMQTVGLQNFFISLCSALRAVWCRLLSECTECGIYAVANAVSCAAAGAAPCSTPAV
jgi:hypothetical protein